ncbi:hypothetical protein [Hyphomicrobium sp. CS1BSMeth3]|uniref:hypothetical protein n=1 Tax=Hyphomicrobium sp. CS1BSMeth3 TaxID=1892844 RepID=UPI001577773B|nr:hypothetical protein [Hyphomicrobium sp. CS1BSMeth3]
MTRDRWILKLSAMGLALALIGGAAHAQAPKAEPKAAPKAETKAPPAEKKAPAKKKAASPCQGLDEKACGANTGCSWIKATKTKAGVDRKAYCRLKTAPPKKAAAPAKK